MLRQLLTPTPWIRGIRDQTESKAVSVNPFVFKPKSLEMFQVVSTATVQCRPATYISIVSHRIVARLGEAKDNA